MIIYLMIYNAIYDFPVPLLTATCGLAELIGRISASNKNIGAQFTSSSRVQIKS
jgi:hypothetical protein